MRVLFLSLFIVLVDQVSKFLVKGISIPSFGIQIQGMYYYQSIPVIGDTFKITFIENPGMAFGLQIGGKLFLSIFTVFATILIFYFIWKNRHESIYLRLSLAFIFGGAVGNLIDRMFYGVIYNYAPLFYGNVVDFFQIDFPDFSLFGKQFTSWPIFNVADIAVSVGFIMILIGHNKIFKHQKEDKVIDTEMLKEDQTGKIDELNPYTESENIESSNRPDKVEDSSSSQKKSE